MQSILRSCAVAVAMGGLVLAWSAVASAQPCMIFVHGKQTDTNTYTNWNSARNYWKNGSNDFVKAATKNFATSYYVVGYNGTRPYYETQSAGEVANEIVNATNGGADGGGNRCAKTYAQVDAKLGVQCESCHGPGEQHVKARMKAAADEEEGKPPSYTKIPDDEIIKQAPLETCTKCHNEESPTYKPFCYHDRVAQIRHLNPLKPRTAEEKAALTACSCEDKCVCKKDSKDGKCTMPAKTDADGNPAPAAGTKDKDK